MEDKQVLFNNIDKVHTTEMGIDRIKKNLKLDTDDVEVCSCNGAYKQYSTEYENMDNEIEE